MNYLLPKKFKIIGWCLFIPSCIFGLLIVFADLEPILFEGKSILNLNHFITNDANTESSENYFNEFIGASFIISGLFVAFSREKDEDEYISKLRLESLVWAMYLNYILLFIALFVFYELNFLIVMSLAIFTVLLIFILRFSWQLRQFRFSNYD